MAETKELLVELESPRLTAESVEAISAHFGSVTSSRGYEALSAEIFSVAEKIATLLPLDMDRDEVSSASTGIAEQFVMLGSYSEYVRLEIKSAYIDRHQGNRIGI